MKRINFTLEGVIVVDDKVTPATELASKLLSAVSECGDHIVINSLTMPCPAGDSFGYVVYHKGDDYFELE